MRLKLAFVVMGLCAGNHFAEAQEKPTKQPVAKKTPLVTKFYRLDELAGAKASFPFTGSLPASSAVAATRFPQQVSQGGGGLAGSVMGGGGGLFRVASTASPQGGGLGGGGMNFGVGRQTNDYSYADSDTVEYVTDLLQQFVEPDSWQDNGGSSLIVPMNQSLLVRAPEENHRKIRAFLNQLTDSISGGQPLQVEAWWLPLNPGERRRLTEILNVDWNDKDKATAAVKDLAELTETSGGHHGELRTRSGRTAHTTGGYRRPLIIGSVPIVGTGTSAVTPIMTSVNYGIALEITPKLVSAWRDLGKESANADSERVAINIKTSLTGIGPGDKAKGTARAGEIDRYDIGAQVLEASAVCHIDRPTILGSLAAIGLPPVEGDDKNEIFIVIRIRR